MELVKAFLTSGIEMMVMAVAIVGGVVIGKGLRDKKDKI